MSDNDTERLIVSISYKKGSGDPVGRLQSIADAVTNGDWAGAGSSGSEEYQFEVTDDPPCMCGYGKLGL